MTKPRPFDPQPSAERALYLWPRARTDVEGGEERNRCYEWLHENGWRFDSHHMLWFTPEAEPLQGHGRLEHPAPWTFRIQPPSEVVGGIPYRREPLLIVQFVPGLARATIVNGKETTP